MPEEDFEEVYTTKTKEEASILKGLLEAQGVPVLLKGVSGFSRIVHPVEPVSETKILVPKEKTSIAKEIIEAFKNS